MSRKRVALWALAGLLLAGCAALCLCHLRKDRPAGAPLPPAKGETTYATPAPPSGTVRVNSADAEELCRLHGIGESLAAEILAERERGGTFYLPEDLLSVRGIGPAKLADFREQLDMQP